MFKLQLKISFNETSLQSTYEYPSENSVWDSGGEEEEEEVEGQEETVASEQPSMVGRIHIPRPNIIASSAMHSSNSKGEFLASELFFYLVVGFRQYEKALRGVIFYSWTNMAAPECLKYLILLHGLIETPAGQNVNYI